MHAQPGKNPALQALNPHQNATVIALSDRIIPSTKTPGAKAAKVNQFIDVIVADWYDEEEKESFLAGLAEVDARSQKLFGKDFVQLAPAQQDKLLTVMDGELADLYHPPAGYRKDRVNLLENNFFFRMKALTLTGYYTSQVGFEQELHESIIPPRHAGCAPVGEGAPGE